MLKGERCCLAKHKTVATSRMGTKIYFASEYPLEDKIYPPFDSPKVGGALAKKVA